jgi:hypothetical protein
MSSMADLASALGGGGAPPDPGTPVPADDTGTTDGETYSTSLDALDGAEEALHSFIQLDPDEKDRMQATKALQIVIGLKASNQDSAASGDMSGLARALQQGGPPSPSTPPPGGGY